MIGSLPLYRLHHQRIDDMLVDGFMVDVVTAEVDFDCPSYDPDDSWTHTVKSHEVAHVTTREAASAVLRLVCDRYQDWTQPGGWNAPMATP